MVGLSVKWMRLGWLNGYDVLGDRPREFQWLSVWALMWRVVLSMSIHVKGFKLLWIL